MYGICPARQELTKTASIWEFIQTVATSSICLALGIAYTSRRKNIGMISLHVYARDGSFTEGATLERKSQNTRSTFTRSIIACPKVVAIIDIILTEGANEGSIKGLVIIQDHNWSTDAANSSHRQPVQSNRRSLIQRRADIDRLTYRKLL
jgi:hypothetical protein